MQAEFEMRILEEKERSASAREKLKQKEYKEILEKSIAEKQALKVLTISY